MFKKLLILLTCISMSGLASASVISVSYTGTVDSISNSGPNLVDWGVVVGDEITGSFLIDLAMIPSDIDPDPNEYSYFDFLIYETEFVSTTSSASIPAFTDDKNSSDYYNWDRVFIDDTASFSRFLVGNEDKTDSSTRLNRSYQYVSIYDYSDLSYINGGIDSLNSFSLGETELANLEYSLGRLNQNSYEKSDPLGTSSSSTLIFQLTSLTVDVPSVTEVPGPNTLGILFTSLLLVSVRRFTK